VVGQWLSERKCVSLKAEVAGLKAIADALPDWEKTYIPHRYDSAEKIALISEFFSIETFDQTFERQLLQQSELPQLIISWYSTVLFTVNQMFPEIKLLSVRVPIDDISAQKEDEWKAVYDAYQDLGIEVLSPSDLKGRKI